MEEEQVHAVPVTADPQSLLTGHKGEIIPEFQEEMLKAPDQRFFEFVLGILVFQAEKFEHERVSDVFVGCEVIAWARSDDEIPSRGLRALVELRSDLAIQLAN
jgi:hypothetical protein